MERVAAAGWVAALELETASAKGQASAREGVGDLAGTLFALATASARHGRSTIPIPNTPTRRARQSFRGMSCFRWWLIRSVTFATFASHGRSVWGWMKKPSRLSENGNLSLG